MRQLLGQVMILAFIIGVTVMSHNHFLEVRRIRREVEEALEE